MKARRSGRNANYFKSREWALTTQRRTNNSSHAVICGEMFEDDTEKYSANVVIQPYYNLIAQLGVNYEGKAAMSLDGLFRPFSTDTNADRLPHFEEPDTPSISNLPSTNITPKELTVEDLNPFGKSTDINVCTTGNVLADSLLLDNIAPDDDTVFRGMALRGPLVIVGWGYDTDGFPVPNENELNGEDYTDEFYPSHKVRADMWKCGPVDLRWDRQKKMWVPTETEKFILVTLNEVLNPGEKAEATRNDNGDTIMIYDELYCNFLLESEYTYVKYDRSETDEEKKWKVVGSIGLTRRVVPINDIPFGSSGDCTVESTIGISSDIEVNLTWMHSNQNISKGVEALAEYIPFDRQWIFVNAGCEETF